MSLVINANGQNNSVLMSNSFLGVFPNFDHILIMPYTGLNSGSVKDLGNLPVAFSVNGTDINFLSFSIAQGFSEMPIGGKDNWGKNTFVSYNAGTDVSFRVACNSQLIGGEIIGKEIIYQLMVGRNNSNAGGYGTMTQRAFLLHTDGTITYLSNAEQMGASSNYGDGYSRINIKRVSTNGTIAQAGDYVGVECLYRGYGSRAYPLGWGSEGGTGEYIGLGNGNGRPTPIQISID